MMVNVVSITAQEMDWAGSGNEQMRRREPGSAWTCAMRKRDAEGEAMRF